MGIPGVGHLDRCGAQQPPAWGTVDPVWYDCPGASGPGAVGEGGPASPDGWGAAAPKGYPLGWWVSGRVWSRQGSYPRVSPKSLWAVPRGAEGPLPFTWVGRPGEASAEAVAGGGLSGGTHQGLAVL